MLLGSTSSLRGVTGGAPDENSLPSTGRLAGESSLQTQRHPSIPGPGGPGVEQPGGSHYTLKPVLGACRVGGGAGVGQGLLAQEVSGPRLAWGGGWGQ